MSQRRIKHHRRSRVVRLSQATSRVLREYLSALSAAGITSGPLFPALDEDGKPVLDKDGNPVRMSVEEVLEIQVRALRAVGVEESRIDAFKKDPDSRLSDYLTEEQGEFLMAALQHGPLPWKPGPMQ